MAEMTGEQARFLLQDLYMGTLKVESRVTKKILEAVPADRADYRPDPVSKSAIELVRHIAAADNRFVETVINGVFDTNPAMIPEELKTPAEIAAWYEGRFAKNYEAPWKAIFLPALYGRKSAFDLWRELRRRAGKEGSTGVGLVSGTQALGAGPVQADFVAVWVVQVGVFPSPRHLPGLL